MSDSGTFGRYAAGPGLAKMRVIAMADLSQIEIAGPRRALVRTRSPAFAGSIHGDLDVPPKDLFDRVEGIHEFPEFDDAPVPESQKLGKHGVNNAARRSLLQFCHDGDSGILVLGDQENWLVGEKFEALMNGLQACGDGGLAVLFSQARKDLDRRVADKIDVFVDEAQDEFDISAGVGGTQGLYALTQCCRHGLVL
jgi:hypothetical protein